MAVRSIGSEVDPPSKRGQSPNPALYRFMRPVVGCAFRGRPRTAELVDPLDGHSAPGFIFRADGGYHNGQEGG